MDGAVAMKPDFYAEQRQASVLEEFVRARAAELPDIDRLAVLRLVDACFDQVDITLFGGPTRFLRGAVRDLPTLRALAGRWDQPRLNAKKSPSPTREG